MVKASLDLLTKRGELDNTYVVYASDNGILVGEHRDRFYKGAKSTPYEEAAGITLVVRGPGVPANVAWSGLVANNDLAPTFADWAGALRPSWDRSRPPRGARPS
jgi:N-acetylglucosamine-6-sulfatase